MKPCEQCGGPLPRVVPSQRHRQRFCSKTCKSRWIGMTHGMSAACQAARKPPPHYSGAKNPKWVEALRFACKNCGAAFERKPWRARQSPPLYCSKSCRNDYRHRVEVGRESPFWVEGKSARRGKAWQRIRLVVVEAQGGACARCGTHVGNGLPVHHIRPFREFASADEANVLSNLIGYCQPCHMKIEPRRRKSSA